MKWQITTPPATEPIDASTAMLQARVDDTSESSWFTTIAIPAARATAEKEAQVSLITRTITATIYDDQDPNYRAITNEFKLPMGPVQSIVSVVDGNGSTIATNQFDLRRRGLADYLHLTPQPVFPINITYGAGFGDAATEIPADIRSIMLAHVAFLYDNRSADTDPTALDRIYRKYRSFAL